MFLFNRYIFGFLLAIGLIVLIVVLLVGNTSTPSTKAPRPLLSYAGSNSAVELDIYGPIVAPQNHNQVDITINQYSSNLTVYQGYNFNSVGSKDYMNSLNSYKAFLAALSFAGYTDGNNDPNLSSSLGYCSVGDIYTFKLINNGQTVFSRWMTNCSGDPSTFTGSFDRVFELFQSQIPDYNSLTNNANI